jgi:hypothetical protein
MQLAFGLRKKEALCVRPWISDQRDLGHAAFILYTRDGTNGGRQRLIPVEFEFQVRVLDYVKAHTAKRNSLGWRKTRRGKDATLASNIKEYEACMGELGMTKAHGSVVTGHGLRAEYAENCALLEGFVPGTLGGKAYQLSPEDLKNAQVRVSERLGHSSPRKTMAYDGKFKESDGPAVEGGGVGADRAEATPENIDAKDPMSQISPFKATLNKYLFFENGHVATRFCGASEGLNQRSLNEMVISHPLKFVNTYYQGVPDGRARPTEDAPPVATTAPVVNPVIKRDGPKKAAEAKTLSKPWRQPMPDLRLASVGEKIATSGNSSNQYTQT